MQKILRRVRALIRKAAPLAEESVSYGIATYKLNGKPLVYFAGFPKHWSLFPANLKLPAALERYRAGKGTLRFPLDVKVPDAHITRFVKLRTARLRASPVRQARRTP